MEEVAVDRPVMAGYGVLPASEGVGLLDWSWATERLVASHDYWIATVRPDGRPHNVPVWGVFMDERLWFSSGPASRKVLNLRANPSVAITTDTAFTPVIVEGEAHEVADPDLIERYAHAADAKYGTDYGVDFYAANATFVVNPTKVIAIDVDDFTGSPTRWVFGGDKRAGPS